MALPKIYRLRQKKYFDAVFKKGKTVKNSFLFIKFNPNDIGSSRFGFIIPGAVSRKASIRNRIRRILSEEIRKEISSIAKGYDFVVMLKGKVSKPDPKTEDSMRSELMSAIKKIKQ